MDLLSVHAKMEQVIALIVLSGAGTYTLIFLGKYFDSKRNVRGLDCIGQFMENESGTNEMSIFRGGKNKA